MYINLQALFTYWNKTHKDLFEIWILHKGVVHCKLQSYTAK